VEGMATKKITFTLDVAQLDRVHELVESGRASSVSGFVQHAVGASFAAGMNMRFSDVANSLRKWATIGHGLRPYNRLPASSFAAHSPRLAPSV
jgi:hypothetical protein